MIKFENGPLVYLKNEAQRLGIADLCSPVLEDSRFPIWSGASKPFQHHYGKGGLVQHVAEVVALCAANNAILGFPVNERKLYLGALFHDVGKMWDYEPTNTEYGITSSTEWRGSPHKRHIHHISRSALVWQHCVDTREHSLTPQEADEVLHAILSHHGQREWGSPVSPNTQLAWLVFLCDGISARMNDADKWDHTEKK